MPGIARTGGVRTYHAMIRKNTMKNKTNKNITNKIIEPKKYKFNPDVPIGIALQNGFRLVGNLLKYRTTLYKFDDDPTIPYVELFLNIENMMELSVSVICNNGDFYIPFVNPDMRHNNLVYEKVVKNYNNIMDKLCKKKILKHVRGKHGED